MNSVTLQGAAASPGFAIGPAFVVAAGEPELPDLPDPVAAFSAGAEMASRQLSGLAATADSGGLADAAEILRAQAMMAEDPMLADEVAARVGSGEDLDAAMFGAQEVIADALRNSGSEYLAERATDVAEVVRRIKFAVAGVKLSGLSQLDSPSVVVAKSLTAADTSTMDPELVLGFVTEGGGPTGHVAVIARALGIPATVATAGVTGLANDGDEIIVDGGSGIVVLGPTAQVRSEYEAKAEARRLDLEAAGAFRGVAIEVASRPMSIAANVGGPEDIDIAMEHASDGIGLFRTEFLFLDTDKPPTEEEQVEVYKQAVRGFDHPVVIRTFDVGGDKPAAYLDLPHEENPFLGVRGMRLYRDHQDLATTQARALLRAATEGDLWVMAPMVSGVGDAIYMRELFDTARRSLANEGIPHGPISLGAMIEVPAAALNATAIAEHVDFFSIGTNDLTQYTMAVDRTSGALASYLDAAEPSVLRLCAMTAEAGSQQGISVSVCGEAGSDPGLALLFAAMGMDKLSVTPSAVNPIKRVLAGRTAESLLRLLKRCLAAPTAADVRQTLGDHVNA
jgi:phosphotransferase system enzyme I (PtsI)